MKLPAFALDVAISPIDVIIIALENTWWIIALAALLVVGAIIGITVFNKNKNKNSKEK